VTTRGRLGRLAAALLALAVAAPTARAIEPIASHRKLPTGNGHGLMVFDAESNALVEFLERPYRYMRPSANPDAEGVVRRNLLFDTYFGVRVGGDATWLGKATPTEVGYLDETNIIRSVVTVGSLKTESYYFAPFGLDANAVVMILVVTNTGSSAQTVDAYSVHNYKLGSAPNPDSPGASGEAIAYDAASGQVRETGPGGGTMSYVGIGGVDASSCADGVWQSVLDGDDLETVASCSGSDKIDVLGKGLGSIPPGESRAWGVATLFSPGSTTTAQRAAWDAYLAGRDAAALLEAAVAEWDAWRGVVPGLTGEERRTWRQSEAVLRMAQILEPYGEDQKQHGMMLASLTPGQWHSGWVRDAAYAIVALARAGHHAEAKRALNFFLDSDAGKYASFLNGVDYRVSTVRYFGNGEEEADFSGQPTRNIEIDGWGLVLWAARAYVDQSGDEAWLSETTQKGDTVYQALREGVAEALVGNVEPSGVMIADASIWEVHWGNREHFLYTTAAAARGLCDMAGLARRVDDDADRDRYKGISESMVTAMRSNFADQNGVLAGSLERLAQGENYRDGAVVEAFTWDLVPTSDPAMATTMGDMSRLRTAVGGFKRVEGSSDPYDTDEWILIDLRASEAYRKLGDGAQADQLLDWVTAQAAVNHHLIPELYNSDSARGTIGRYAGSIPMVGYGAGAYLIAMLERAGATEHRDCGTVDPDTYADAGAFVDGGPEGDGGPGGFTGRTGTACVCDAGGGLPDVGTLLLVGFCGLVLTRRRRGAAALVLVAGALVVSDARAEPSSGAATGAITIVAGDVSKRGDGTPETWFELHGYARMPLNLQSTPREPYLVDADYYLSGFAYTRLYEPDWTELFVSAHHGDYRARLGIFASLYSDYAEAKLDNQFGIAQASVAADRFLGLRPLSVELGVFWDRFGYLPSYDTYLFGRTHQGGVKARWGFAGEGYLQAGVGVHQALLQQNQGVTPIAHLVGGVPVGPVLVGGYLLRSWTRDQRQLSQIEDGTMWVVGLDARVRLPRELGEVYAGASQMWADSVLFLAPAIELLHSTGGRGLTENYFGLASSDNGTGRILSGALEAPMTLTPLVALRTFGMVARVDSEQVDAMDASLNKDDRYYLKWGVEPTYRVHPHIVAGLRYDRVVLDLKDAENSFRAISPRVVFPLLDWGELAVQFTHYVYGDKIQLRPGQVPLETEPDRNAFKLQASAVW
jgi:GH15 family glucan-1,4-alpha-glucosidase